MKATPDDFAELQGIFQLAADNAVSLCLSYHECCDEWSWQVMSPAPAEEYETDWVTLAYVNEDIKKWLNSLADGKP